MLIKKKGILAVIKKLSATLAGGKLLAALPAGLASGLSAITSLLDGGRDDEEEEEDDEPTASAERRRRRDAGGSDADEQMDRLASVVMAALLDWQHRLK